MSSDNSRHENDLNDAAGNPEPAVGEPAIDSGNPPAAPRVPASETGSLNRLHPASLLFDIVFYVRSNIIPAIIGLSGAATGSVFGLGLAGIIFVPTVLGAVFRFLTLRYGIQNGELVVTEGLFYRRFRKVPVSKIQNIDMVQTVLHRLFQVAEVRVETASGAEVEAKLRVLSMDQVAALRDEISRIRAAQAPDSGQEAVPPDLREDHAFAREQAGTVLLQIPLRWLVRAGVASGRGMIILGLIIGAVTQFNAVDIIDFERVRKIIPAEISTAETVVGSAIAIIAGLLALRLLSIVWFILRFYDYRLSVCGKELRITCGLLTKVSATIPRRRIQFISVHRTLLMRWMGLSTIRIETAGGAGIHNEDASTTVSKRWFIPVVPDDRVAQLLGELRPGLVWAEAGFNWRPLSAMAGRRLVRLAIIQSILLGVIGIAWTRPWGWAGGIVLLPVLIWWALKKGRSMRYARFEDGVIYRSGLLTRKTSVTFFEKIQTLRIDQSPFDRRWRMATLSVDTAAAGPAGHRMQVPYLDEAFARDEFCELVHLASSYLPIYS